MVWKALVNFYLMNQKAKNVPIPSIKKKQSPSKYRIGQDSIIRIEDDSQEDLHAVKKQMSALMAQKEAQIQDLRKENQLLRQQLTDSIIKAAKSKKKAQVLTIRTGEENETEVLAKTYRKLETVVKDNFPGQVEPLAKIAKDLAAVLTFNPQNNNQTSLAMLALQEKITQLTASTPRGTIVQQLTLLKEGLKKQRQNLIESLQNVISSSLKAFQDKELEMIRKESEIIKVIPTNIKDLKQAWRKKEEGYKQQLKLLESRIIAQVDSNKLIVQGQNKLIKQLGHSLTQLKAVYDKEIQIPLISVRESVQKEIVSIKTKFSSMHENTSINSMIEALINALSRYSQSKNQANYHQMQAEIRKIGDQLAIVNQNSVETLGKLRDFINRSDKRTFDTDYFQKVDERLSFLKSKKKDKEELQLELKYHKQKEYIEKLEKYNKKLEQSIMRTQKQRERSLYQEWKSFEETYRFGQRELNLRLSALEAELSRGISEVIEIKKSALAVQQTQNSLSALFETFQDEIVSIQGFKDELFNFLQNQLRFKHDINMQVQIFNKIFVEQYSRLSELEITIPKSNRSINYDFESLSAVHQSIEAFQSFCEDYEALFRSRNTNDTKFSKYLTSLGQLLEDHNKRKAQPQKIVLELDLQPMKHLLHSSLLKIEDQLVNARIFREALIKGMANLKQDFQLSRQEFQSILKFVKESKLLATIGSVGALAETKQQVLKEVQEVLKTLIPPEQDYEPLNFLQSPSIK